MRGFVAATSLMFLCSVRGLTRMTRASGMRAIQFRGGFRRLSAIQSAEMDAKLPLFAEEDSPLSISSIADDADTWKGDVLVLPVFSEDSSDDASAAEADEEEDADAAAEDTFFTPPADSPAAKLDASTEGLLSEVAAEMEFKAKAGSSTWLRMPRGSSMKKVVLYGMGSKPEKIDAAALQKLGKFCASFARSQKASSMAVALPAEAAEVPPPRAR